MSGERGSRGGGRRRPVAAPGRAFGSAVRRGVPLLICLAALNGCSSLLKERAPDRADKHQPWRVHCETATSHRPDGEHVNKGVSKSHWLVALDADKAPFQLQGVLQDGFLRLDSGQPTEDQLREGCIRALTLKKREQANEIARILAFRESERVNVAIEYPVEGEPGVRRLIIFGDSLSDTGNIKARLRVFPAAPYWIGRFSNGPMWPDYIQTMSTLSTQNHAVGGASVSGKDTIPKVNLIQRIQDGGQFFVSGTTGQQIDLFSEKFMTGERLAEPETTAVLIWGGANDYISKEPFSGAIETLLDRRDQPGGYPDVVAAVIARLEQQIQTLLDLGATRILVGNLPDLGLTPIVLENETYAAGLELSETERRLRLSQRLTSLTEHHNREVLQLLEALRARNPKADLALFDARLLFDDILDFDTYANFDLDTAADFDVTANSRPLGDETDTGSRTYQSRCYTGGYMGESSLHSICDNPQRSVFWDAVHPTTYVHCWIAFGIHDRMSELDWVPGRRDIGEVGSWCGTVADLVAGHEELRALRYGVKEEALSPLD